MRDSFRVLPMPDVDAALISLRGLAGHTPTGSGAAVAPGEGGTTRRCAPRASRPRVAFACVSSIRTRRRKARTHPRYRDPVFLSPTRARAPDGLCFTVLRCASLCFAVLRCASLSFTALRCALLRRTSRQIKSHDQATSRHIAFASSAPSRTASNIFVRPAHNIPS